MGLWLSAGVRYSGGKPTRKRGREEARMDQEIWPIRGISPWDWLPGNGIWRNGWALALARGTCRDALNEFAPGFPRAGNAREPFVSFAPSAARPCPIPSPSFNRFGASTRLTSARPLGNFLAGGVLSILKAPRTVGHSARQESLVRSEVPQVTTPGRRRCLPSG